MGCAVSCLYRTTMALFGKHPETELDARAKLERKLYLARESPEADFDLSECQLRQVPSGIYSICKVFRKDHLYLQSNNLRSLEGGGQLSDLYLLKVLNINFNTFSKLPSDIRYLVNLTELFVQNNFLKDLPDEIEFMVNLRIFDISENKLIRLTPSLGKLKQLRRLSILGNPELTELCSELCYASNLTMLEFDNETFTFPPPDIGAQGTAKIMQFLCDNMGIEYNLPDEIDSHIFSIQTPNVFPDPFAKQLSTTWEQHEATLAEQENKMQEASKQQREKLLSQFLEEQLELDSEIAKIHEAREIERQKLIKNIQEDEKQIECLVNNFIQHEFLKPEVLQQQLVHEQVEHDRLLEIARQNYDNVKKGDMLKALNSIIFEDYNIQHSKKSYEDSLSNMKQSVLLQELEGVEKLQELIKAKDESRTVLVEKMLDDQDVQKAMVASLVERVDARSWSLNEEISLISSNLAKLSIIEQEKKRLQVSYNYNELLHQRTHLLCLLDDLLDQQCKRRKQLLETLKEMECQRDNSNDFWLKNYQKLLNSAPKTLLNIGNHLDPVFANFILKEGVIHCLPFLVKFICSEESLLNITPDRLKENGVLVSADRDGIIRAINYYVQEKNKSFCAKSSVSVDASAPSENVFQEPIHTGVVSFAGDQIASDSECVICMEYKYEVVFVPCGHMCCCQSCANKEIECCPICRSGIERKIKIIIS